MEPGRGHEYEIFFFNPHTLSVLRAHFIKTHPHFNIVNKMQVCITKLLQVPQVIPAQLERSSSPTAVHPRTPGDLSTAREESEPQTIHLRPTSNDPTRRGEEFQLSAIYLDPTGALSNAVLEHRTVTGCACPE